MTEPINKDDFPAPGELFELDLTSLLFDLSETPLPDVIPPVEAGQQSQEDL